MSSRKRNHHHHKNKRKNQRPPAGVKESAPAPQDKNTKLEIVLKCDTSGCAEAVTSAILALALSEVEITIISLGVGVISKSDIFMAETGSRMVVGFNVGLTPNIDQVASEHNVDIRLYDVIYKLLDDLKAIAESLVPREPAEEIIGSAKVIALFKSSRKGIILGCEVLKGKLVQGHSFRVLGTMGQLYTGKIESLHIEKDAVREAAKGQQVGLKISDFKKVAIGYLVESFQAVPGQYGKPWKPQGKVFYP